MRLTPFYLLYQFACNFGAAMLYLLTGDKNDESHNCRVHFGLDKYSPLGVMMGECYEYIV